MDREMENGWQALGGIQEVHSSDQIDQLNDLRLKMQSAKFNLPRATSEKISENEMHGIRKKIPKEETYNKYGDAARKVEIEAIGIHGTCAGVPFSGIPEGVLNWGKICLYRGK